MLILTFCKYSKKYGKCNEYVGRRSVRVCVRGCACVEPNILSLFQKPHMGLFSKTNPYAILTFIMGPNGPREVTYFSSLCGWVWLGVAKGGLKTFLGYRGPTLLMVLTMYLLPFLRSCVTYPNIPPVTHTHTHTHTHTLTSLIDIDL